MFGKKTPVNLSRYREKSDPFAVENLDSNNVLEAEIAAIAPKAATGDLGAVMRKGALETKLLASSRAVPTLRPAFLRFWDTHPSVSCRSVLTPSWCGIQRANPTILS